MADAARDLWLGDRSESTTTDFDGRLRRCHVLGRLTAETADDSGGSIEGTPSTMHLWVRLDPPLVLGDGRFEEVVLRARHVGYDIDRLGDSSISVYVFQIRSKDGFDDVLAHHLNLPDRAAARDWAKQRISMRFSIIDALNAHGATAPLGVSGIAATQLDLAGDVIEQLKAYADAFFDGVQNEKAPSRPATQRERDRLFDDWLGSDAPIGLADVQKPRDTVRQILRGLPAVATATTVADLTSLRAAAEALAALRAVVGGHDFNFRDRADYAWMFDLATRGVPGGPRA
jgi:hypothetical protein